MPAFTIVYCPGCEVYTIFYCLLHGIYTTTYDAGGRTSLRSVPPVRTSSTFWCHTLDRSYVVTLHQRTNFEYLVTGDLWGSVALFVLKVYHRVQTDGYAAVLTCRQLFLYAS